VVHLISWVIPCTGAVIRICYSIHVAHYIGCAIMFVLMRHATSSCMSCLEIRASRGLPEGQ